MSWEKYYEYFNTVSQPLKEKEGKNGQKQEGEKPKVCQGAKSYSQKSKAGKATRSTKSP